MMYYLSNPDISLAVSSFGAQMQSICSGGQEYLWSGDPAYWAGKAPNLFSFIGRLTNGRYTYNGKMYEMDIHGFAKDKEFELLLQTENKLTLQLKDDNHTYFMYPFHFIFQISYEIVGTAIYITYNIENRSHKRMFFGVGGHPGFKVPLGQEENFEDYYLSFGETHVPTRVGHTDSCFLNGIDKDFLLRDGHKLPLSHDLFDDDAIVLKNMADRVTLMSDKSKRRVELSFPDMHYLGIWHKPRTKAPYVCIEPWTSLPSRQDIIEDIRYKSDMIRLEEGKSYQNKWSITVS